ncbi:uncharacterized protein LOC141620087 [Silene latifolia]|uniref:uncharacterized protein LOC141620087 n=1 Tax=Silene latifolia TaxID=37657 RepID=UPI003D76A97A
MHSAQETSGVPPKERLRKIDPKNPQVKMKDRAKRSRNKGILLLAPPIYEVKFINGGSEICGFTSSADKRVARESKLQSPFRFKSLRTVTFDDSDLQEVPDLHHDSLVITMQISTAKGSKILIDRGSSINLVMLDVLKAMKIDEEKITKKSSVLVRFSGETKSTLGEINLPTYAEGVASYERFRVLDYLSSYNVILGRPWIRNVKAIPSTYHQCEKIPTE